MKKFKIVAIIVALVCLFCTISIGALATETISEDETETVAEPAAGSESEGIIYYKVDIDYSDNSVKKSGVSYTMAKNPVTGAIEVTIIDNSGFGLGIYDDDMTERIDGVKVNGKAVDSMTFTYHPGEEYKVEVLIQYDKNILGLLAAISDGKADISTLWEYPLFGTITLATVVAFLSTVFVWVANIRFRGQSRKAQRLTEEAVDKRAEEKFEEFKVAFCDILSEKFAPVLENNVKINQNIIKALALSQLKSGKASVELLDLFGGISNTDVGATLEEVKAEILANTARDAARKKAAREKLATITKENENEIPKTSEKPII